MTKTRDFSGREEAIESYRAARSAFIAASDKSEAAFMRWFTKVQHGERTNAAQAMRLADLTNYASADLCSAESHVYSFGIDPRDVDDDDNVHLYAA